MAAEAEHSWKFPENSAALYCSEVKMHAVVMIMHNYKQICRAALRDSQFKIILLCLPLCETGCFSSSPFKPTFCCLVAPPKQEVWAAGGFGI